MTNDELKGLVSYWNALARVKPFTRLIPEDESAEPLLNMFFKKLSRFHPNIVQQAMDEEIGEARPDLLSTRFMEKCFRRQPASESDAHAPYRLIVHDRSGIFPHDLRHDRSAFALHVSTGKPWEVEFFTRAADLIEQSLYDAKAYPGYRIDWQRLAKRYRRDVERITDPKRKEWRLRCAAMGLILAADRKSAIRYLARDGEFGEAEIRTEIEKMAAEKERRGRPVPLAEALPKKRPPFPAEEDDIPF